MRRSSGSRFQAWRNGPSLSARWFSSERAKSLWSRSLTAFIALHKRSMGVAAILKEIRSMEDKEGNRYEIGQTSVYQIIADPRRQTDGHPANR